VGQPPGGKQEARPGEVFDYLRVGLGDFYPGKRTGLFGEHPEVVYGHGAGKVVLEARQVVLLAMSRCGVDAACALLKRHV
jgi:hypothetical protein